MCLVLLAFHSIPTQPVVLAANRDEFYDRPSRPPRILHRRPLIFGGRDARAGGTWLAVNEYGVIAGVTNREEAGRASAKNATSRGLLCLNALKQPSSREAVEWVAQARDSAIYNPFTFVAVDIDEAWFTRDLRGEAPVQLRPGWRLLGNTGLDDTGVPRVRRARELLDSATIRLSSGFPAMLASILRDHGEEHDGLAADAVCRHGAAAGTRSSSIVVIEFGGRQRFWHAEGAPCETEFRELALPWEKRASR